MGEQTVYACITECAGVTHSGDNHDMSERTGRRRFLAAIATSGSLLAGCLGGTGSQQRPQNDPETSQTTIGSIGATTTEAETTSRQTTESAQTTTETTTEESCSDPCGDEETTQSEYSHPDVARHYNVDFGHPAAKNIGLEPTAGKFPGQTEATIVEFQDASCAICQRFDAQTFPMLYSNLIQTGKVTFVSRDYAHTHDWADAATRALNSTYARRRNTYWILKSWYYANQGKFTTDNILDKTYKFVSEETSVNADAVIHDVKNKAYDDIYKADEQARKKANVSGTPVFFLFKDGEFVTRFTGNQSYSVFKNSLGL